MLVLCFLSGVISGCPGRRFGRDESLLSVGRKLIVGEKGAKKSEAGRLAAEELVTRLGPLGDISARAMFGGHGIFHEGAMFGLVTSAGVVHLGVDEKTKRQFVDAGAEKHGKMPYYSVPASVMKNTRSLHSWAKGAIAIARAAKKK